VGPCADRPLHCCSAGPSGFRSVGLDSPRLGSRHLCLLLPLAPLLCSASGLHAPSPSALVLDPVDASVRRSSPRTLSQRSCDVLRTTPALCAVHQSRLDDCVDAASLQTFLPSTAYAASQSYPQPQPPRPPQSPAADSATSAAVHSTPAVTRKDAL